MTVSPRTARQFDNRDGFDLVDYAEVGLPIFRLTIEAVTLARQELPTTHEFVLRAIGIGEDTVGGIADLLGLESRVVVDALSHLAYDGSVNQVTDAAESEAGHDDVAAGYFEVTDLGSERLANGEHVPQETTLVFDFDGIRRRPVKLGTESVLRPKELAQNNAIQLRPYPADPPQASDLDLKDVSQTIRRRSGKDYDRSVLAIRRITRRDPFFRSALGLVYRHRETGEVQLGFAIGDQIAEDYEIEFARHGGAKKPGLVSSVKAPASALRLLLSPEALTSMADPELVSQLRRQVNLAIQARTHQAAELERLRQRPKLKTSHDEDFSASDALLDSARTQLDNLPLRPLACYEQWELLNEALDGANERLYISSADVDPHFAPRFVISRIRERVKGGATVQIDTTATLNATPRGEVGSFEPGLELWLTAQQQPQLSLGMRQEGIGDLFVLIKDRDLAVISNRPFLCARDKPLSFVPTIGVVTRNRDRVDEIAGLIGLEPLVPQKVSN
tara:strand:+ start:5513 stop:7024 length:1512 start_codon:yes stop_codon:yes gene_type:complete